MRTTLLTIALLLLANDDAAARPAAQAQRVHQLLGQARVAAAARALAAISEAHASHPAVLAARGNVLFHQGRYAEAAKLLRRAVKASPRDRALAQLLALASASARAVANLLQTPSPGGHFRFFHTSRDRPLVHFAAVTLETMRGRLQRALGYAPPDPIRVEIFERPRDLARVSPLTAEEIERSGTIALCKFNRLMAITPRALLRGYGWRDTLAHEFVHLVVSRISHNNVPIWLHEGLAKFFEARWRRPAAKVPTLAPVQRHLLATALARKRLVPWRKMHPSMAKLSSQREAALAFAQVHTAIAFLAHRGGDAGLRRLVEAMRSERDAWRALTRQAGLSRRAFERGWRAFLRSMKLKPLPGLTLVRRSFGKPSKEQRLAQIRRGKARRYFRLADMLRQRGRRRAAIIEYEKASALERHDPVIGNALARTYLAAGDARRAAAALAPVVAYYPELAAPRVTLGLARLRLGDKRAATRQLQRALGINPFDPELHCALARAIGSGASAARHQRLCRKLGGARR